MSHKAAKFLEANARSPVVYGSAHGTGGAGCFYRLQDGSTWDLSANDCQIIGHPRWAHLVAA